jgi:hypothetical protein
MAYTLEGRPDGTVKTLVAVEADMSRLANLGGEDRPRTVVTLSIAAAHRDSGRVLRLDQRIELEAASVRAAGRAAAAWDEGWLALSREFDLPPGVSQARIVIRDEFLGRLGALTLRFVVPPASGLRLSTPLLTNRVMVPREGPARPIVIARREFFASDPLFCQFEVFGAAAGKGAAPRVEASYELRRRGGDVVRRSEPSVVTPSADGRLTRLVALNLDGVAQGDYELVLRVANTATGETQERIEPLHIARRAG